MRIKRIAKRALALAIDDAGMGGICSDIQLRSGYMMQSRDGGIWYYPHGDCADSVHHGQRAAEVTRNADGMYEVQFTIPGDFIRYHQRDEYHNRREDGDLRDKIFVYDLGDWIADQSELLDRPLSDRVRAPQRDSNPRPRVSGTFGTSRAGGRYRGPAN